MDMLDSGILTVIYRLLPGFVSAWIFYGFTAHPKKDPFERVVQALIFTVLAEFFVLCLSFVFLRIGHYFLFGTWTEDVAFFWRFVVAVVIGLVATVIVNTNWFRDCQDAPWYKWLPKKCRDGFPTWFTKRTTYPSEWYSAFHRSPCYAFLNLTGERRLYGWVEEFPDSSSSGHFSIMEPAWVLDDNTLAPVLTIERMLIPAAEVEIVEFERACQLSDYELMENKQNVRLLLDQKSSIDAANLSKKEAKPSEDVSAAKRLDTGIKVNEEFRTSSQKL